MPAPCAPAGCPLRPATAGPDSPGRAGSRTAALLPRPPRWPCPQRHDTARDKITFACGPCRSVALRGMRPQSSADRRIWSVPCRGALPRARICEPARAPQAMPPVQEKTSVGEAPEPAVPRRPAATNSPHRPATHNRSGARSHRPHVTRCSSRCAALDKRYPPDLRGLTVGKVWLRIGTDGTFGAGARRGSSLEAVSFRAAQPRRVLPPGRPGPGVGRRYSCAACPPRDERLPVADRFPAVRNDSTIAAICSASRTRSRWPPW